MNDPAAAPRGSSLDNPLLTNEVDSDELLQVIVHSANHNREFGVGVTLAVNGCIVTGTLIGESRWFIELEAGYPEVRESLTTPFRKSVVDEGHGADIEDNPQYVHLKGAHYLTGAGFAPNERATGFFWRGRLSHVSAWSLGEVGPNRV